MIPIAIITSWPFERVNVSTRGLDDGTWLLMLPYNSDAPDGMAMLILFRFLDLSLEELREFLGKEWVDYSDIGGVRTFQKLCSTSIYPDRRGGYHILREGELKQRLLHTPPRAVLIASERYGMVSAIEGYLTGIGCQTEIIPYPAYLELTKKNKT
ncbi:MAG: hypothetical protein GW780_00840 [Candidatus Aenigmarchaeota archaeon]|nr:hypothetical protein [Candidatus Aenigmarchaeota archaeon]